MRGFSLIDLLIALILLVAVFAAPLLTSDQRQSELAVDAGLEDLQQTAAETATPAFEALTTGADRATGRAFYTRRDGQQRNEIWSVGLDGSKDLLLSSCSSGCTITDLAAAPDGAALAYIASRPGQPGELRLLRTDGSGAQTLAGEAALLGPRAFTPDGSALAFVRYRYGAEGPEASSIWVVSTTGGAPRQVTPWHTLISAPAWFNQTQLIFSASDGPGSKARVYRVDGYGSAQPEELHPGWLVDLAPDRTKMLVFSEPAGDATDMFNYAVIALDRQEPQTTAHWQWPLGSAAWSPDGARIALLSQETGSLHIADLPSATQRQIKNFGKHYEFAAAPAWTADSGAVVVALGSTAPDSPAQLQLIPLSGGDEKALARFTDQAPLVAVTGGE